MEYGVFLRRPALKPVYGCGTVPKAPCPQNRRLKPQGTEKTGGTVIFLEKSHEGHRARMKNRFLETGLKGFEKHNILELLLFYSIPRRDTNEIAHELLDTFGSLSGVFDAPVEELTKVKNITLNSAILIKMIPALSAAYLDDRNSVGMVLNSTEKIGAFLLPKFVGKTREHFLLLCLDNKNKLLSCTLLGEGELNKVQIQARKIAEYAFKVSASSVVLAHNHPQGFAFPSDQDIYATKSIQKILRPLDITLLDHIIVAGGDFVSLFESGLLAEVSEY